MTSTNDLMKHSRLSFAAQQDGSTEARFAMNIGADIVCRYWPVSEPGRDPWTYELETIGSETGGRYSHVSERGCRIMIIRHLVKAGVMGAPEDNTHLDARNAEIAAETETAREAMTGKPRVGDFVIMPDGTLERCCHAWPDGMQTTHGGSFHVSTDGHSSFSGSLNRSRIWEYFKDTGETRRGKFWFFSHGRAGAGRGVDVFLPCRVYRLDPFPMTEDEARAHPKATAVAKAWGENHRDHLAAIAALMKGDA
ncbi:MAG: hypothetical protein AAF982_08760 [Pseudomonadota bacterium]